jgi:uncharacterized protein YfaS (alpha-2-macroglobulin family)
LKVRRQFLTRNAEPIGGSLKQNQLVVVLVSISSTLSTPIENVVVTDMLPAAFEIENPRLNENRTMTWKKMHQHHNISIFVMMESTSTSQPTPVNKLSIN